MITVHHLENSRSQRVLWLLEELEVAYDIKKYKRDPDTSLAPAELVSIHPLGKSPVISDGDVTVAESGAIIEYLVAKYDDGRLKPANDTGEQRAYTYWLHYAEGSLMPLMIVALLLHRIETAPMPFFIKPVAKGIVGKVQGGYLKPNLQRHLRFLESTLIASDWFAGAEFSAADIQMAFALDAAEASGSLDDSHPAVATYLQRVRARPAYQRALERGGPYDLRASRKRRAD